MLPGVPAHPVQAPQIHVHGDDQGVATHLAVRLRDAVVRLRPTSSKGGPGDLGPVVRLAHDGQLERPGVITGQEAGRDAQLGICLAVVHKALFSVALGGSGPGQDSVNGTVTLSRQEKGLGGVQSFAEHRGQVVEVGQLVVHEKAGGILAHILDHIGGVPPVAEAGAAGGVHQVAAARAKGEGREKYRLAFQAFHLVEGGFNSCAQAGEQDGTDL